MNSMNRDRPSRHGAILGEALAEIAAAGRAINADIPPQCATCAFEPGCMTNQMGATGILALNCVTGVDPDDFACHHGMKEGWPTKLCAGYAAAQLVPRCVVMEILTRMKTKLDAAEGPDPIRESFDRWWLRIDPEGKLDNYQLARLYLSERSREEALVV